MPTARELLDQADALMRRNRLAPAPLPVAAVAPAPAAASAPVPTQAAEPADDGIPTLTDAVPPPVAEAPAPAPPQPVARSAAPSDLDDVPLLTDAVEEIEAPSILEEPPDADAPDAWTDTLTGAHTIIPEVPLELPPAQDRDAEEPHVGVLPEEWGAPAPGGAALTVETIDIPAPLPEPPEARPVGPDADAPPPPFESFPAPATHAIDSAAEDAQVDETQPATPFEWPTPSAQPAPEHAVTAAASPATEHAAPAPPSEAEEDARWSALAEEVRMQVLQRIDLFTDTGLREQLAARLQPIVDRASADLVATINQHVGVLLRAYVAEAIEREIERWRADGR